MGNFKEGEFIEVSGNLYGKVVYADENVFACREIYQSHVGAFWATEVKIYSNKPKYYEGKYWIRRAEPLTDVKSSSLPVLGGGFDL